MVRHLNPAESRFLASQAQTLEMGAQLASAVEPGMVIYLQGDLGAGKTTLARGLLTALGVKGRIKSPTFSLVEVYEVSRLYLYHFDFYRIIDPDEWIHAGLREYFGASSICLVEWPERAGASLPQPDLTVHLEIENAGRRVTVDARTKTGHLCLARIQSGAT